MFVKTNHSGFDDALQCEAEGLAALARASADCGLRVPRVSAVDSWQLQMTEIQGCAGRPEHFAALGRGLAGMHRHRPPQYGWHRDNYIGLNPQFNTLAQDWGWFFVEYRLARQIQMIEPPSLRSTFRQRLERCQSRLQAFLNSHCRQPSLLHGDLWSGNVMFDACGGVWLIDPAVYWGDREVDLAMTEMFGGFPDSFYRAYDAVAPRSAVYAQKRDIYNLYHYLNHYNLFGDVYLGGCERGLAAIEAL